MKWLSRVAMVLIGLLSVVGLAVRVGASTTTTTAPAYGVTFLCDNLLRVDQLIVTRQAPGNQFRFAFPSRVMVTSASLARGVAVAACALPNVPKGEHCAAEVAVSYSLNFVVDGDVIVANPTGCETVAGLGPLRTTQRSDFYRLLGHAMRVKHPGRGTFAGTRRQ
jgi:hypothetical protein